MTPAPDVATTTRLNGQICQTYLVYGYFSSSSFMQRSFSLRNSTVLCADQFELISFDASQIDHLNMYHSLSICIEYV